MPEPIDRDIVQAIVPDAQRVPSWCNALPWRLVIAGPGETDALRAKLCALDQSHSLRSDIPFPERHTGIYQDRRRTRPISFAPSGRLLQTRRTGASTTVEIEPRMQWWPEPFSQPVCL